MKSKKLLKHILGVVLVLGILIPAGGFAFPLESLADGTSISFTVSSTTDWQDTGLEVQAGDTVEITATGSVRFDSAGRMADPDGQPDGDLIVGSMGALVPDEPSHTLVGRIGSSGSLTDLSGFLVGSDYLGTASESGKLFLGFNDIFVKPDRSGLDSGGVGDNSGSFSTEITITHTIYSGPFDDHFYTLDMDRWDLSTGTGPGEHYPTTFDPGNVITTLQDELQIRVPYQTRQGGQIVTDDFVSYGRYRARIKASSVDNTIQGFFVYAHEYEEEGRLGHREIDIEFGLTEHRNEISFGTWINGVKELIPPIALTWDPSEKYYEYGFDWYEDRVDFWVGPFRVWQSDWEISPDPSGQPLKLMFNNWVKDWPPDNPPLPQDDSYLLVDWVSYQPQYGELVCQAFSPVDISIMDPDGLVIDMDTNEIAGAAYAETDLDSDGDLDDLVTIPQPRFGDYKIGVVPDPTAELTETYTLQVVIDGETIMLAENTPISDIPDQGYIVRCDAGEIAQIVPTTMDFDPHTLNLKSQGKVVTVYVELPTGYDMEQIDISSIMLNGVVPALVRPTEIGDYDKDGTPDLMVKFDRAAVKALLTLASQVEVTIMGEVAGIAFEGTDTIRVINS